MLRLGRSPSVQRFARVYDCRSARCSRARSQRSRESSGFIERFVLADAPSHRQLGASARTNRSIKPLLSRDLWLRARLHRPIQSATGQTAGHLDFDRDGASRRPRSAMLSGAVGCSVSVEVQVSSGLPGFTIVGLPDAAVREARDRVRAAVLSSGLSWPMRQVDGDAHRAEDNPLHKTAALMRSRLRACSSGRPTIVNPGKPLDT